FDNHGGHGEHRERQFEEIYDLTQRVIAKYHAIYCFYSVFSVNSVVNCFFKVYCKDSPWLRESYFHHVSLTYSGEVANTLLRESHEHIETA
ncbi:MAG: hypothetical protein WC029_09920, partial [Sulfuricella sp.]